MFGEFGGVRTGCHERGGPVEGLPEADYEAGDEVRGLDSKSAQRA
ncbi:hypothetical protein QA811_29780 [Streptomyces sp. B21-102]